MVKARQLPLIGAWLAVVRFAKRRHKIG